MSGASAIVRVEHEALPSSNPFLTPSLELVYGSMQAAFTQQLDFPCSRSACRHTRGVHTTSKSAEGWAERIQILSTGFDEHSQYERLRRRAWRGAPPPEQLRPSDETAQRAMTSRTARVVSRTRISKMSHSRPLQPDFSCCTEFLLCLLCSGTCTRRVGDNTLEKLLRQRRKLRVAKKPRDEEL